MNSAIQEEVLEAVEAFPNEPVDVISEITGFSASSTRQHLVHLIKVGRVKRGMKSCEHKSRGRAKHIFRPTTVEEERDQLRVVLGVK